MEPTLSFVDVLEHLEISLIPWIAALIIGGGLGYLIAILIRRAVQRFPRIRTFLILFPWRSVIAWIALVAISSPVLLIKYGLGPRSQIATNVTVLFLIVFPWSIQTFLGSWFPSAGGEKAFSIARTLGVLSLTITTILRFGIGIYIERGASLGDLTIMSRGFGIVGVLLLVLDILLGLIQLVVLRNSSLRKQPLENSGSFPVY
jgi:hypothetical protein